MIRPYNQFEHGAELAKWNDLNRFFLPALPVTSEETLRMTMVIIITIIYNYHVYYDDDPNSTNPSSQVFVSLLLGFFITHSVARWTSCVESFLGLFEAGRRRGTARDQGGTHLMDTGEFCQSNKSFLFLRMPWWVYLGTTGGLFI